MRAWAAWVEMLDGRARLRKMMNRALHGDTARAFATWVAGLEDGARIRKLGSRFLYRDVSRAWNQWVDGARAADAHSPTRCHALSRSHALATLATHAPLTMARSHLTLLATPSLCAVIEQKQRAMQLMTRALSGGLLRGWNQWLTVHDGMAHLRKLAGRALNGGANRAFIRWLDFVEEKEKLALLARRMMASGVVRAFNQWLDTLGDRHKSALPLVMLARVASH